NIPDMKPDKVCITNHPPPKNSRFLDKNSEKYQASGNPSGTQPQFKNRTIKSETISESAKTPNLNPNNMELKLIDRICTSHNPIPDYKTDFDIAIDEDPNCAFIEQANTPGDDAATPE
nr:hypothetical protein [Endozoicomonas sp.]